MSDSIADSFQISPQQARLWASEPDGPRAVTQAVLAIEGEADTSAIVEALRSAVGRHESLRTTFARRPGFTLPLQVVNPQLDPHVEMRDLSAADPEQAKRQLEEQLRSDLHLPFDHEQGPLVRATLLTRSAHRTDVALTLSGLCADHVSASLLLTEIATELAAAVPADDPLQYPDFSAWQHELGDSVDEEAREAQVFWQQMQGVRSPALPFTRPPAAVTATELVDVPIDDYLDQALAEHATRYRVSAGAFVQAAWHAVLGRYDSAKDTAIAYLAGERRHLDLEGAVGAFARPVPVQARIEPTRSFVEVVAEIEEARVNALVRQDYAPVEASGQVEIGFVEYPSQLPQPEAMHVRIERIVRLGQDLFLSLMCAADARGLTLRIAFDPSRYRRETVTALAEGLALVLRAAAADPGVRLADIEVVGQAERQRLLREFNDTAAAIPQECAHELIARWASLAPDREAVVDADGSITYAELDARANQLAHRLRAIGIEAGDAVGLCADRSISMVTGLLGILKAGGAYVPLHYEHPSARLRAQLLSAKAKVLVTQEGLLGRFDQFDGAVICLDRDRAALQSEPSTCPPSGCSHEDLAYVIYTSGSTGEPKGVGVTHRNLANYVAYITAHLRADDEPLCFGLVTSISTDLGNTSVFGALCSGGTLVLLSPDAAADPGKLASLMRSRPLDVLKITPSHIGALLAARDPDVLPRRWLIVGGERAGWDLVERVRALGACAILNHYGPTETTIGCCTLQVGEGPGEYAPASVPIGAPISNTSCYVLDDAHRLTPLGVAGRLFVAGAGVARGYVGKPEITAERFLANPFAAAGKAWEAGEAPTREDGQAVTGGSAAEQAGDPAGHKRMYDTGDLARWLPDGTLEFLGRVDEQIKLRGYRVEPDEVAAALRAHSNVREAIAIARAGASGETRLLAYCTGEGALDRNTLRSHLQEWLPEYMLPDAITILDELPRTPSGKIDKLALPDPDLAQAHTAEHLAPRTPLEEAVAAIWAQVLGLPQVGVEDDFFALGGHSLLATQVVAQVRSDFAVDLPLHSLFTCPTVASLAGEIVRMMGDSEQEETARLMAELEGMSDEEAQRLLVEDQAPQAESG